MDSATRKPDQPPRLQLVIGFEVAPVGLWTERTQKMPLRLSFSATTVKEWFQYRCERKAVYATMRTEERAAIPIAETVTTSLMAEEGQAFELLIAAGLQENILRPPSDRDSLSADQARAFLEGHCVERFAYQLRLTELPSLRSRLQLQDAVTLSAGKIDLVRRDVGGDGNITFTVIDVKGTQVATLFHKAQVAYYAILLDAWLREYRINARVSSQGEIWRRQGGVSDLSAHYESDVFALSSYENLVLDFFHRHAPRLATNDVSAERDTTTFHIYFKCEQCKYLAHCKKAISADRPPGSRDLSAIPGMSHESKATLRRLGFRRVGDVVAAKAFVEQSRSSGNWALSRRAQALYARAQSQVSGRIAFLSDRVSFLMPAGGDVAHYLLCDTDAVAGNLATIAYRATGAGIDRQIVRVLGTGSFDEERQALREVLGSLLDALATVDARNGAGEELRSHIYLYEPAEANDFRAALGRHLDDPQLARALLHALRIFPPDDLVPEPEYRGAHHLPATAVRSVVEQLLAAPAVVSYDLRQVTAALVGRPGIRSYLPAAEFFRPFSSRLSIDVCRGMRRSTKTETREPALTRAVARDVESRLASLESLVTWLQAENANAPEPFLRLSKKPFRFQESFDPLKMTDLDIVRAHEMLDDRAGLLGKLIELSAPARERIARFSCLGDLEFVRLGPNIGREKTLIFRAPHESRNAEIAEGDFGLILHDDDPGIRLDPSLWPSFSCTVHSEAARIRNNGEVHVRMQQRVYDGHRFKALLGRRMTGGWFIDKTYANPNFRRTSAFLAYLSEGLER